MKLISISKTLILSFHIIDFEQLYREINITNFGRIFAYLTFVCFQRDSEEYIFDVMSEFFISQGEANNKHQFFNNALARADCFVFQSLIKPWFILLKRLRWKDVVVKVLQKSLSEISFEKCVAFRPVVGEKLCL